MKKGHQVYTLGLIAAISREEVLATQILEGGVDSVLFDNFLFNLFKDLHNTPKYQHKEIWLLIDNASTHCTKLVSETAQEFNINILFNA